MGPITAASLALLKKDAKKKQKDILAIPKSAIQNQIIMNGWWAMMCCKAALIKKVVNRKLRTEVKSQETVWAHGLTPRISSVSFMRVSRSSTKLWMRREVGYKKAMTRTKPRR